MGLDRDEIFQVKKKKLIPIMIKLVISRGKKFHPQHMNKDASNSQINIFWRGHNHKSKNYVVPAGPIVHCYHQIKSNKIFSDENLLKMNISFYFSIRAVCCLKKKN